jgi:hypothetical protein
MVLEPTISESSSSAVNLFSLTVPVGSAMVRLVGTDFDFHVGGIRSAEAIAAC